MTLLRVAAWLGCLGLAAGSAAAAADEGIADARRFVDTRDPPPYRQLSTSERERFDLGHAVANTQWVPAGTPGAERRDGLGPLFNAPSCDACHNEGAHGRGPAGDGAAPAALVIKLALRGAGAGGLSDGDPVYGHVLNTAALEGLGPEAVVTIHYRERAGRYPDGESWTLRVPEYHLEQLRYGPLSARTLIRPRLAPQLFGVGLLEAVPPAAVVGATPQTGRFGWQRSAVSIRDQTAQAFAFEMGITSADRTHDDCTLRERDCLRQANGGDPEVSADLFEAVVQFQRWLAVPQSPRHSADGDTHGSSLFAVAGCSGCHQPRLPIEGGVIEPYTDLRPHDLGRALWDRSTAGTPTRSEFRTSPLWGLGYRLANERPLTLLHDGRARSVEEAILWHGGEAGDARRRFEQLSRVERQALLAWLERR